MSKSHAETIESIESLERKIAAGRKRLYEIYTVHGCTDSAVLAYSIKLDKLINQYQAKISKMNG